MQIGMTATPRGETGEHLLYDYPLRRALREGLYTKSVHICVRQFADASLDSDDIDKSAIQYSLDRLNQKEAAVASALPSGFPPTKPVCVFFARDIDHAGQVREWLIASGRVRADEVLLTHSQMSKSEEEIERLLGIEEIGNPIRVVVNVMELTEGWDVTNVYVVTPLRVMATFQGALQAMGRGLRLPAGRRVEDPVLDELDVVCFGREALTKIVSDATTWTGGNGATASGLKVTEYDKADPVVVPVQVAVQRAEQLAFRNYEYLEDELRLELAPEALQRVKEAVVTDVDLASAQTRLGRGRPKLARTRFLRAVTLRVIRKLGRYLSDAAHFDEVEQLVIGWLDFVRPGIEDIDFDPAEVGEEIASILEASARLKPAKYRLLPGTQVVGFPAYCGKHELMLAPGETVPTLSVNDMAIYDGTSFVRRQLYRGWRKALHAAYPFDSEPEALLARLFDSAESVIWWVRNSPPQFRLDTPAGEYRPDFIIQTTGEHGEGYLVLEAKGDYLWKDPLDDSRLKAAAAKEWAAAQTSGGMAIRVGVVLESEIRRAGSWAELHGHLEADWDVANGGRLAG